jgi:hypothetical protein
VQFNSHATAQDIVSLANELSRQNDSTYPLAAKVRHANAAVRIITGVIHDAYGGWRYDDRNQTDLPRATSDLVSGQTNYALPTDSVGLAAVYIQNEADDEWTKLTPLALEEIPGAEPSFEDTNGNPWAYRMTNNSIVLYPPSSYSKDDAIMVEYDRDISSFATTDTTKSPGFDPLFHEAVPTYMAWQKSMTLGLPMASDLAKAWHGESPEVRLGGWLGRIRAHYARKFRDKYPASIKTRFPINDYL